MSAGPYMSTYYATKAYVTSLTSGVAEELHLLANFHRGNAASNCGVVAPLLTNLAVRLVLDGGGLNGDVGTEFLVALWQLRIPEDGDVWLR